MMSSVEKECDMALGVMPSQFLNFILARTQSKSNSSRKRESVSKMFPLPKSMKRVLDSETVIVPVYTSSKQAKVTNGNHGSMVKSVIPNFPFQLPAALLAECTLEILNAPVKNPLPDEKNVNFSNRNITNKQNKVSVEKQSIGTEKEAPEVDIRDLLTSVEVVYSDDEDSSKTVKPVLETQNPGILFPFSCEYCPNKFSNRGALWQHTVASHSIEKTCECNLCGRKFYRNCSLALHMKSHSDEYNCACSICGREFNRFTLLQRHAKLHSEVAQYKCTACNKSFEDLNSLQLHATEHKDKLACNYCEAVFTTKESLEIHTEAMHGDHQEDNIIPIRMHGDEKLYACRFCGKTYGAKAIVKKHELIHTGERLKCEECGIEFTQKSSLMRHVKRIHPTAIS